LPDVADELLQLLASEQKFHSPSEHSISQPGPARSTLCVCGVIVSVDPSQRVIECHRPGLDLRRSRR
jgi:hypothetical protein